MRKNETSVYLVLLTKIIDNDLCSRKMKNNYTCLISFLSNSTL